MTPLARSSCAGDGAVSRAAPIRAVAASAHLPAYVRCHWPRAVGDNGPVPVVSVIIPAFDEAARIGRYLDAIDAYFTGRGEHYEIIVADDGSRDDTARLIHQRMEQSRHIGLLHYADNRGKGHAVRMGMRAARGHLRLFADADGSTPIAEIERLRRAIERDGADIAIGSRARSSAEVRRVIKPHRRAIGECFRLLRMLCLRVGVIDSQCGFKLFRAEAAERIFSLAHLDGFAFDVELLYLAVCLGMRIQEVPVNWYDSASTRVNLLVDPFKMLADTIRIRRLHRGLAGPGQRRPGR